MSLEKRVHEAVCSDAFRQYLTDLLLEICRIDTTPNSDVAVMRDRESTVFAILERELRKLTFRSGRTERRAINPAIAQHPAFSQLHFTKTAERPEGLSAEETYAGRTNLLYLVDGTEPDAAGTAMNAHIDVVAPFFPPEVRGDAVVGRGACDDKAGVVSMVGALSILNDLLGTNPGLPRNVVAMFVVEEETGGNGSLSLAIDRELKKWYDTIVVLECTDLDIHPANRGAVWYRAELELDPDSVFECSAFVIEEMEKEGRSLRAESRHPLFPQRPVQTCHGIIGPFGEHPSRICGRTVFAVEFEKTITYETRTLVDDCIASAIAEYVGLYGDKTNVTDPGTGKAKVDHHIDVEQVGSNRLEVTVHGKTGHMGSVFENDGAITKMATIVRALVRSRPKLEVSGAGTVHFRLAGADRDAGLNMEGGQGFVPTHTIEEVMRRMADAAEQGVGNYLRLVREDRNPDGMIKVSYNKLHNAAFDGDPDSMPMRHAIAAAEACGVWHGGEVTGWHVSCDARLFADEFPDMSVITTGVGTLDHAHSDVEQVDLGKLQALTEMLVRFLLKQLGLT